MVFIAISARKILGRAPRWLEITNIAAGWWEFPSEAVMIRLKIADWRPESIS